MLRDVSASVRVANEPVVMASLVLEAETGLALGARVASDGRGALVQALGTAATGPPGTLPASTPGRVLCAHGLGTQVRDALGRVISVRPLPPVTESEPVLGAEDVFDSFLGHLSGREQPDDMPDPGDWSLAMTAARGYREQAPWERWSDAVPLRVTVTAPNGAADYVAVVLGAEGIQRGLALYPGSELPAGVRRPGPRGPSRPPAGTLMLFLDPASELPPELVQKAFRYGWPAHDELVPAFMSIGRSGPRDPDRRDLHHLSLACTAVTAHDRRGPIVVGAASATTGELDLDGEQATYSLTPLTAGARQQEGGTADGTEPPDAGGVPDADGTTTIATLLDHFLADQRARLAPRTLARYETVVFLLADCLNAYGHLSLDEAERRRWEAAFERDEDAFVHLFGADKIVDNLGEFLGYFMIRKVLAGEDLLRAAGTVTKKLVKWLAEHGHLEAASARSASEQAAEAGRELPLAERLSRLLYEQTRGSSIDLDAVDDDDYVEDYLMIERVEPGRLWLEGGIGPVEVPKAASAIARPGWSLTASLVRRGRRWHLVGIGNVYP